MAWHIPQSQSLVATGKFIDTTIFSTKPSQSVQDGCLECRLYKTKTFSPFSTNQWELTDGPKDSPRTMLIRRSPFATHASFERRDGTLIADQGTRMLMAGSEFLWGGKVYR